MEKQKNLYLINSIYTATEGEGIFIGRPQIFIRYQGCAIACANCDSKDTWAFDESSKRTLDSILTEVNKLAYKNKIPLKRVSITGGDPLHPKFTAGLITLVQELKKEGFYINLEAAGTRVIDEVFDVIDYISFDYKTPSTKVKTSDKLIQKIAQQYQGKIQIKSVIKDEADFNFVYNAYERLLNEQENISALPWCLTPEMNTGEDISLERFQKVNQLNEGLGGPFRVIGQQHKWVYGVDTKYV